MVATSDSAPVIRLSSTLVLTSQAAHWLEQEVSQQTPSTQNPEPHSVLLEHAMPFGLLHFPAAPATLHLAPPAHDAEPQQTPSTQLPEAHEVAPSAVQLVPSASFAAIRA
mgnify:CR=1 FL=1